MPLLCSRMLPAKDAFLPPDVAPVDHRIASISSTNSAEAPFSVPVAEHRDSEVDVCPSSSRPM